MKSKNLLNLKSNVLRTVMLPLMVVLLMLGATSNVSAQKYEVTGSESVLTQATEIKLSGSTIHKFYYLFRIDENGEYQYIIFQVGQGTPLEFAPQKTAGKYVIYEFDNFKEAPFNFEKFKPMDGILQTGEISIVK